MEAFLLCKLFWRGHDLQNTVKLNMHFHMLLQRPNISRKTSYRQFKKSFMSILISIATSSFKSPKIRHRLSVFVLLISILPQRITNQYFKIIIYFRKAYAENFQKIYLLIKLSHQENTDLALLRIPYYSKTSGSNFH